VFRELCRFSGSYIGVQGAVQGFGELGELCRADTNIPGTCGFVCIWLYVHCGSVPTVYNM